MRDPVRNQPKFKNHLPPDRVHSRGPLLSTSHLVKAYGQRAWSMAFPCAWRRGEIVGLLGPNGAGKTTTFQHGRRHRETG